MSASVLRRALSSASYQNASPLGFAALGEEAERDGVELSAEEKHQARLVRAATYVQRAVRIHNMIFNHFARVIFSRKNGRSSDHGTLQFPAHGTEAQFLTIADTTPASMIVPFLVKVWKLPTPEIIISVTGGAQALTLPAPLEEEFNKVALTLTPTLTLALALTLTLARSLAPTPSPRRTRTPAPYPVQPGARLGGALGARVGDHRRHRHRSDAPSGQGHARRWRGRQGP